MLNLLAQTYTNYTYDTTTLTADDKAGIAGLAIFSGFFLILYLVILVVGVIAGWKIFEKAGVEGWKVLIPFYNYWVLCEIAGKPGWWSLVWLISWVPFVGYLASLAVTIIICIELAKSFGKEPIYALLFFVPLVGVLYFAFGDAKYVGPGGKPGGSAKPKAPAAA